MLEIVSTTRNEPFLRWKTVYAYASIVILLINYFLAQYDKFILSYFQDDFSASLSLSSTQYGILSGYAPGIVFAIVAIPVAAISDYLPHARVWILTIAALWWSLCVVFQSLAKSFVQVFLARIGMGIGQAAVGPLSISLISDLRYSARQRSNEELDTRQVVNAFLGASIFYVGVYVGEAISGQIATAFQATESGWRTALRAIGIAGLVVGLVMRIFIREPPRQPGLLEKSHVEGSDRFKLARVQLRETISCLARLRSFWLIVLSASMRQLAGNVFGFYMPSYLSNEYPSQTALLSRYGIIAGTAGSASVIAGGILTALMWQRTKLTPLYLTAIGGMVSSVFVLLMIFSHDISSNNGIGILYGCMSAAYVTAETWLGILEMLVALILPSASKTFGLAIYESIQVLIYSSGPEIIGLALRGTDPGSEAYTRATQIALAVIIPVGYWLCGIGLLSAVPLLKKDLGDPLLNQRTPWRRKIGLYLFGALIFAMVVSLFVASIVIDTA